MYIFSRVEISPTYLFKVRAMSESKLDAALRNPIECIQGN